MFLQFLTGTERVVQTFHQLVLLGSQFAGILRVDGGEVVGAHHILLTFKNQYATLIVDMV